MPKGSPIQNAFNGGQFGPRMEGRTDLERYRTGCNTVRNFNLTMQGPAVKRSGTKFVIPAKYSDRKSRLIEFEFSREQAYILEMGDLYMRVFRDGGAVLNATQSIVNSPSAANPVNVEVTGHGLATDDTVQITGSSMTELNDRFFTITYVDANNFTLNDEDGTGRTTGTGGTIADVYEVTTPWDEDQVFDIQTAQSQDVLYVAHPDVAPTKIERTADTSWTVTTIDFDVLPFRVENSTDTTMYVSAATGTSITLTASAATFDSGMVGSYVRLAELVAVEHAEWSAAAGTLTWYPVSAGVGTRVYYGPNVYELTDALGNTRSGEDPPIHEEGAQPDHWWEFTFINRGAGWGKITGYTSSTVVTVDVDTDGVEYPASVVGSSNATKKWTISSWSAANGYPRAVAFYEDRLWWGGTAADPQAFWGSRTGQYENYEIIGDQDDAGLLFVLASDKINSIEWMSGDDVLLIGTRGSEYTADSGSDSEAITPSNIRVRRRSNYGSAANVQPLAVDSALLFVQRSGRRLHELIYDFDSDRYIAPDLTDLSYDILDAGVKELAYQASPFRQVWALLDDGSLAALTYIRDEDVAGWGTHVIGGTDVVVESIGVIPHPDDDEDQLWMLVKRTINGGTVRYIEYLEKPFEGGDNIRESFFVDSGLSLVNPEFTVLSANTYLSPTRQEIATTEAHGLTTGDRIVWTSAFHEDNRGKQNLVTVLTSTTFELEDLGGSPDVDVPMVAGDAFSAVVTGFTTLHHLEGETVTVLGDGIVQTSQTVTDGAITLATPSSATHVGLAMPAAQLETMRLESGMDGIGTAQGRRKRIHQIVIRLDNTGDGLSYGSSLSGTLDDFNQDVDDYGVVPLFTDDMPSRELPGGWNRAGRVAIQHDEPLPCTVVAIMPQLTTEGR